MKHHTSTDVLDAVLAAADGEITTNEDYINRLIDQGYSFPLVTDPEILDQYPVGTHAFDKDYKIIKAVEGKKISSEELIRTRGPIHILYLLEGATPPQGSVV